MQAIQDRATHGPGGLSLLALTPPAAVGSASTCLDQVMPDSVFASVREGTPKMLLTNNHELGRHAPNASEQLPQWYSPVVI